MLTILIDLILVNQFILSDLFSILHAIISRLVYDGVKICDFPFGKVLILHSVIVVDRVYTRILVLIIDVFVVYVVLMIFICPYRVSDLVRQVIIVFISHKSFKIAKSHIRLVLLRSYLINALSSSFDVACFNPVVVVVVVVNGSAGVLFIDRVIFESGC